MYFNKVEYHKKYLKDAALMMSNTWNYHSKLDGCKDSAYFYSLLFRFSNIDNKYTEFIANGEDKLIAILIATSSKHKMSLKALWLFCYSAFGLLTGKFGKITTAYRVICCMLKEAEIVMKDRNLYDQEISLFFIDQSCRGQGLGKKLMNNYIDYCKQNNVSSVILLTDAGCNYGFYDNYGFKRINEIHSKYFAHVELEKNGFAYAYNIVT